MKIYEHGASCKLCNLLLSQLGLRWVAKELHVAQGLWSYLPTATAAASHTGLHQMSTDGANEHGLTTEATDPDLQAGAGFLYKQNDLHGMFHVLLGTNMVY